jgi:hypothetical protein
MKKITCYAGVFALVSFCLVTTSVQAQNTSPFWSLQGNSNATRTSKLGTTNAMPVGIFSNNRVRMFISPAGTVNIGNGSAGTKGYQLYVKGATNGGTTGTYGDGGTYGVNGYSSGGYGVYRNSFNGYGVYGNTTSGYSAGLFSFC